MPSDPEMPPPEVVVEARVDMLRGSLARVKDTLDDLRRARTAGPVGALLDAIAKVTIDVSAELNDRRGSFSPDAIKLLEDHVLAPLAEVRAKYQGDDGPGRFALDEMLESALQYEVTEQTRALDDVASLVREACDEADDADRNRRLGRAWTELAAVDDACRDLFVDYVDLIRAVPLRDAELDNQLFRIADELLRPFGRLRNYEWRSLSIPATRESRGSMIARLIRIPFPEWSIWVLPLAAHDLGDLFVAEYDRVQSAVTREAQQTGLPLKAVTDWAADAFATSLMGPAFAWAAIMLRIDPVLPTDHLRVEAMLTMLERMAQGNGDLAAPAARARGIWDAVVAHTGPPADAPPPGVDDAIGRVVAEVAGWVRDSFGVKRDWFDVTSLSDYLAGRSASLEREPQVRELRHVLNGAWLARLDLVKAANQPPALPAATRAEVYQAKLHELASMTRDLCLAVIDGQPVRPVGRGLSQPAASSGRATEPRRPEDDKT